MHRLHRLYLYNQSYPLDRIDEDMVRLDSVSQENKERKREDEEEGEVEVPSADCNMR